MPAIEKLEIKGFKAFPQKFELNLDGKHLLLYGENGSGKSSIYYALHCLFQSPFKQDGGKKYFDDQNPQNLINKDSTEKDGYITLTFMPPHPWIYKIDKNGYNTELHGGIKPIPGKLYDNVFINHKFISNFFSCRNSEDINLFSVFYKDIFPYILTRDKKHILADIYDYIINNPSRRKEYKNNIESLNIETKHWIDSMNLNISNIYNDSFRDKDDCKLKINLIFKEQPKIIDGETIYYWGRYDYRTYKEIVANEPVIKKVKYKSYIEPHIGLYVEEITPDGNSRPIDKPQTYFNEAKLTAIALAIRFSILDIVSDANGRFMALDDMLISLDMSNRTKVVNYLLNIASDKYMIYLFTHDRAFFELTKEVIVAKNIKSNWIFKELYKGDIALENPKCFASEDSFTRAIYHFKNFDYPASANYLRKAVEELMLLFPSYISKNDNGSDKEKLRAKIDAARNILTCTDGNTADIQRIIFSLGTLLNPLSHRSIDTNIYRTELQTIIDIIPRLRQQIINLDIKEVLAIENDVILYIDETDNKRCEIKVTLKTPLYSYVNQDGERMLSIAKGDTVESVTIDKGIRGDVKPYTYKKGMSLENICKEIYEHLGKNYENNYANLYKDTNGIEIINLR